jgi:galactoside O-acetyltransferase
MVRVIKKILRAVLNAIREKPVNIVDELVNTGNLTHGENCRFENFQVTYTEPKKNQQPNIVIGKNCHLQCTIIILNPDAKVVIGNEVFIGGSTLFCRESIEIGNNTLISWGCTLIDNNTHSVKSEERKTDVVDWMRGPGFKDWSVVSKGKVSVESDCWIGFNAIIAKGVTLGKGSIVASGSVVTKSTEPFSVVGGNPAQFIKKTV